MKQTRGKLSRLSWESWVSTGGLWRHPSEQAAHLERLIFKKPFPTHNHSQRWWDTPSPVPPTLRCQSHQRGDCMLKKTADSNKHPSFPGRNALFCFASRIWVSLFFETILRQKAKLTQNVRRRNSGRYRWPKFLYQKAWIFALGGKCRFYNRRTPFVHFTVG